MVWPFFVGVVAIDLIIKHTKKRQEDPIPTGKNRIWVGLGWQGRIKFYSDIKLESLYEILKDVPRQYHNKICHDLYSLHTFLIIFKAKSISFFFTLRGGNILTTFSPALIVNNLFFMSSSINFV